MYKEKDWYTAFTEKFLYGVIFLLVGNPCFLGETNQTPNTLKWFPPTDTVNYFHAAGQKLWHLYMPNNFFHPAYNSRLPGGGFTKRSLWSGVVIYVIKFPYYARHRFHEWKVEKALTRKVCVNCNYLNCWLQFRYNGKDDFPFTGSRLQKMFVKRPRQLRKIRFLHIRVNLINGGVERV